MNTRTVLFVDDDELCREVVRSIIAPQGVRVVYASSGEEAVAMLKEQRFSTMITDLHMPGMDGFELAMVARELAPSLDIVLTTGDIAPNIFSLAADVGITRVLFKPYEAEHIRNIVIGATPRHTGASGSDAWE